MVRLLGKPLKVWPWDSWKTKSFDESNEKEGLRDNHLPPPLRGIRCLAKYKKRGDKMAFQKLPSNSKALLDALVNADNPTQELCERWDSATGAEMDELKGIISELRQLGYLNVQYADNKPYRVSLTNSARTYNERLAEHEDERARQSATYIVDQSVRIGDHNKINNSNIAGRIQNQPDNNTSAKKKFSEKHPILLSVIVGLATGFILLFSFWQDIVNWIEGLF